MTLARFDEGFYEEGREEREVSRRTSGFLDLITGRGCGNWGRRRAGSPEPLRSSRVRRTSSTILLATRYITQYMWLAL